MIYFRFILCIKKFRMKSLFTKNKIIMPAFLLLFSFVVSLPVIAENNNQENNKLKIFSDEAKYDRKNKVALATGHVKIIQDNVTIFTSSVLYNEQLKTSFIDNFVRIVHRDKETKRKTDIQANKMVSYHQEKKVHLEKDVRFDREEERKSKVNNKEIKGKTNRDKAEDSIKKERTVITSDLADYWTKTGNAIFNGDAVVLQKEKKASGETITVNNDNNKNTDTIKIEKNAKIIQIKGEWLAKEGIIDPKEDKEKERLVKEKLEMNADTITIFQKTSDVVGDKNVKIVQNVSGKQRQATGNRAVFNDLKKTMTITGNVKIKRENEDWLTAEKAIFHTDSENFEAFSTIEPSKPGATGKKKQVESEFVIPDEDKPTPEPPIPSSEPGYDLDIIKKSKPAATSFPVNKPPVSKTPVPGKPVNSNPSPTSTKLPVGKPTATSGEFSFPGEADKNPSPKEAVDTGSRINSP